MALSDSVERLQAIDRENRAKLEELEKELEQSKVDRERVCSQVASLEDKVDAMKVDHQNEVKGLLRQVSKMEDTRKIVESERDQVREELHSMQGMVDQETASLRFQLSTNNMSLQQLTEVGGGGGQREGGGQTDNVVPH